MWAHMQERARPASRPWAARPGAPEGAGEGQGGPLRELRRADRGRRRRARRGGAPHRGPCGAQAGPAPPASCSSRAASSCWSRPAAPPSRRWEGKRTRRRGRRGTAWRRSMASGTQLASFTDTESPPGSLAVGEGAVWVLGLERQHLVAHRSGDEKAGEALQAAPRSDRHRRGRRRRLGQGRWRHPRVESTRIRARPPGPSSSPRRSRTATSRSRTGASRRSPSARAPSGRSTTTGRSPGSTRHRQAGGDDRSSTPPRSRPAREGVWFISADDTRAVTRIDPSDEPGGAEDPGRSPEPLGRRRRGRPCLGDRGGRRRRLADRPRTPAGPPDVRGRRRREVPLLRRRGDLDGELRRRHGVAHRRRDGRRRVQQRQGRPVARRRRRLCLGQLCGRDFGGRAATDMRGRCCPARANRTC